MTSAIWGSVRRAQVLRKSKSRAHNRLGRDHAQARRQNLLVDGGYRIPTSLTGKSNPESLGSGLKYKASIGIGMACGFASLEPK
jgi:hypothetical protein